MRYQSKRAKRQFLAGVKCPQCEQMDVVVQVQLFEPQPDEYIECTQCGHSEHRPSPDEVQAKNAKLDEMSVNATGTSGVVKFIDK